MKQRYSKLKSVALAALTTMGLALGAQAKQFDNPDDCITFMSEDSFAIGFGEKKWDGALYYSTDKCAWTEVEGETSVTSAQNGASGLHVLHFRGTGNSVVTGEDNPDTGEKNRLFAQMRKSE